MADDKNGREKQARDAEKRQRTRDIDAELARGDEPEPPVEPAELAALDEDLSALSFPATGDELVAAVGDRVLETATERYTVDTLVPETETFESPAAVRTWIQRPTVAAAMTRVTAAAKTLQSADLSRSRRDAYEKTFRALHAVDADDDDEGVQVISEWIVDHVQERGSLPGSRDVRRQAAKFCRTNGYQVRDDEWLGI